MIPCLRDAWKVILFRLNDLQWASEADARPLLWGPGISIAVARPCHLQALECPSYENFKNFMYVYIPNFHNPIINSNQLYLYLYRLPRAVDVWHPVSNLITHRIISCVCSCVYVCQGQWMSDTWCQTWLLKISFIIPSEQRSCWGVYWFQSVRLSVHPSVCPSVCLACRVCSVTSTVLDFICASVLQRY